jgi:hypothetical protein
VGADGDDGLVGSVATGVLGVDGLDVVGSDATGVAGVDGSDVVGSDATGVVGVDGLDVAGSDATGVVGVDGLDVVGSDAPGVAGVEGSDVTGSVGEKEPFPGFELPSLPHFSQRFVVRVQSKVLVSVESFLIQAPFVKIRKKREIVGVYQSDLVAQLPVN